MPILDTLAPRFRLAALVWWAGRGLLVADPASPCPIGWDVFDDKPGPQPSRERGPTRPSPARPLPCRPAARPGLAAGHAGDVHGLGLGHLDR